MIKYIFNTKFISLILCNTALYKPTFGYWFQSLEISQKAQCVILDVTGKSVIFFIRKLVNKMYIQLISSYIQLIKPIVII